VRSKTTVSPATTEVQSTGAASLNAWNILYWGRGIDDPTKTYLSLNGEALVTGSHTAISGPNTSAMGRLGGTTPVQHFAGMICEPAIWDGNLNEPDDRYKALANYFAANLIPQDPNGTNGSAFAINLLSYSPLIGDVKDSVLGTLWSNVTTPTVATGADSHPRIKRNFLE
jgi:hypothetical protein